MIISRSFPTESPRKNIQGQVNILVGEGGMVVLDWPSSPIDKGSPNKINLSPRSLYKHMLNWFCSNLTYYSLRTQDCDSFRTGENLFGNS